MRITRTSAATAGACALLLVGAAACGSSSSGGSPNAGATASTGTGAGTGSSSGPTNISISSFTRDFSVMSQFKGLASAGKGSVGVILPDTTSSARYTEFDAPYLTKAFETAGLSSSDFKISNAQGSDSTFVTDAEADITNGATVLLIDPEDPGTGERVANYAKQHGVTVIDYDRITAGSYYISFNNVQVGQLIGDGFKTCAANWGVSSPKLIEMVGAPTDNNATQFAEGYNKVISANPSWKVLAKPAGTWDPPTALTEFQQAYTANPSANSAIIPNDENAGPIISYLKNKGIKAKSFPITGQDATLVGLHNVLSGYQCGTAYKPYQTEAQAAAAVALYARAGKTPPSTLANAQVANPNAGGVKIPSVLLTPEWVTTQNMGSTVVADNLVSVSQLCSGSYASECKAAGINS